MTEFLTFIFYTIQDILYSQALALESRRPLNYFYYNKKALASLPNKTIHHTDQVRSRQLQNLSNK